MIKKNRLHKSEAGFVFFNFLFTYNLTSELRIPIGVVVVVVHLVEVGLYVFNLFVIL